MGMTLNFKKGILNYIKGTAQLPVSSGAYLGLLTISGEYSSLEVSQLDYSRVKVEFSEATGNTVINTTDVTFRTALSDWGQIKAVGIYDKLSGGNLLFTVDLNSPITVGNGIQIVFKKNYITISLT